MNIYGNFPAVRMRRMRRDEFSRRLMRETTLTPGDLLYPVFILDGKSRTEKVASMPGVERMTLDKLLPLAEQCVRLGIPVLALFPVIDAKLKTADGREAYNARGLIPRAVAASSIVPRSVSAVAQRMVSPRPPSRQVEGVIPSRRGASA